MSGSSRPGRLEGKVCVITGAASGIGAETARLFAEEGATVVGIDVESADTPALAIRANVCDEAAVRDAFGEVGRTFGRLDVLVNNAGISPPDDVGLLDESSDVFDRVLATNLKGVFLCCKHGVPHLLRAGGGSVVNTASFVAVLGAATSQIGYTASKGGVLALTRELGVQLARDGVRVNALCPGPVDTPLLRELYANDPAEADRRLLHVPMGRFASAREIASAALFLASDDSSYVTASTFLVDGGLSAAYVTPQSPLHQPTTETAGGGRRRA